MSDLSFHACMGYWSMKRTELQHEKERAVTHHLEVMFNTDDKNKEVMNIL